MSGSSCCRPVSVVENPSDGTLGRLGRISLKRSFAWDFFNWLLMKTYFKSKKESTLVIVVDGTSKLEKMTVEERREQRIGRNYLEQPLPRSFEPTLAVGQKKTPTRTADFGNMFPFSNSFSF